MKKLSIFILVIVFGIELSHAGDRWIYRTVTEDHTEQFTVSVIKRSVETTTLQVTAVEVTHIHQINNADGATLAWQMQKPGESIKAVKKGRAIELSLLKEGRTEKRIVEIDDKPWLQFMGWGLQRFVKRKDAQVQEFWIIRPSDYRISALAAKKKGEEKLDIGSHEYASIKVNVSVAGWRSMFWGVNLWFRKSDGRYLKYKGANGPPGTPETISELSREL
jgi:hypothetical protein